jgi:hypothetical protein
MGHMAMAGHGHTEMAMASNLMNLMAMAGHMAGHMAVGTLTSSFRRVFPWSL